MLNGRFTIGCNATTQSLIAFFDEPLRGSAEA